MMTTRKALLHELLKEEQEPFHLKNHISQRSTKRVLRLRPGACFRDAVKSPPTSPCKPQPVFLRVPPGTAALLLEAAARIVQRRESRIKNVGLGFMGACLNIMKDRSKNQRRDINIGLNEFPTNSDFGSLEQRCCPSPFRFSLASPSGRHAPVLCTPAASDSPGRRVRQKEDHTNRQDSDGVNRVEEEIEQFSPVSVLLDPFVEDHDHEQQHVIEEEEDDEYDTECSYANVQRVKQQLLDRLRRFEKLAELDPLELERNLLEDSEDEYQRSEGVVSEDDDHEQSSTCVKQRVSSFLLSTSSRKISTHKTRRLLGSDHLKVQKKLGVICNPKEGEVGMVDMLVELESKRGFDTYEEVEETIQEIELAIFDQLVEEYYAYDHVWYSS